MEKNASSGKETVTGGGVRWRWWGATAGLATGLVDAIGMAALGVSFEANGREVTLLVGAYFGVSFAVLGFLLGLAVEARRRDRRNAELLRVQMESLDVARAKLAETEKLAALGQLAAAVAHEVRNPLAVIRSAAQEVAETIPAADADGRRACSFIGAEIDRLNNVITSLLAFARPLHLAPRAVSVGQLLDAAVLLAPPLLDGRDVRLRCSQEQALPLVQADPDLLSQVLLGLITNAVESLRGAGEVGVEARAAGDGEVEIAVVDSGPGVPADLRKKIFEPFFTTRERGTGLGLAVARQIVEGHGGRIEVSERSGGGARFAIRLPVAPAATVAA